MVMCLWSWKGELCALLREKSWEMEKKKRSKSVMFIPPLHHAGPANGLSLVAEENEMKLAKKYSHPKQDTIRLIAITPPDRSECTVHRQGRQCQTTSFLAALHN